MPAEGDMLAQGLVKRLTRLQYRLALAESCTAGLVAGTIASVPGASQVLWGGYVCYTAEAKAAMLGIDPAVIEQARSENAMAFAAMAEGALRKSGADIAVSVTGLAGPDGDDCDTAVGTVWIGAALRGSRTQAEVTTRRFYFTGDRQAVREAAVDAALKLLLELTEHEDRH